MRLFPRFFDEPRPSGGPRVDRPPLRWSGAAPTPGTPPRRVPALRAPTLRARTHRGAEGWPRRVPLEDAAPRQDPSRDDAGGAPWAGWRSSYLLFTSRWCVTT